MNGISKVSPIQMTDVAAKSASSRFQSTDDFKSTLKASQDNELDSLNAGSRSKASGDMPENIVEDVIDIINSAETDAEAVENLEMFFEENGLLSIDWPDSDVAEDISSEMRAIVDDARTYSSIDNELTSINIGIGSIHQSIAKINGLSNESRTSFATEFQSNSVDVGLTFDRDNGTALHHSDRYTGRTQPLTGEGKLNSRDSTSPVISSVVSSDFVQSASPITQSMSEFGMSATSLMSSIIASQDVQSNRSFTHLDGGQQTTGTKSLTMSESAGGKIVHALNGLTKERGPVATNFTVNIYPHNYGEVSISVNGSDGNYHVSINGSQDSKDLIKDHIMSIGSDPSINWSLNGEALGGKQASQGGRNQTGGFVGGGAEEGEGESESGTGNDTGAEKKLVNIVI